MTIVEGPNPRPAFKDVAKVTPDEALAVWQPFAAGAGTFEITRNEMIRRAIVAKNPGAMRPGGSASFTVRSEGRDTLWITTRMNQNGPVQNPITLKLARAK